MHNREYEALLEEIAVLLQVAGANPFRVRAFERAARAIHALADPVDVRLERGDLTTVDGIGASIASDLAQMRASGSCEALDALRAQFPPGLPTLFQIQGLGPKKVKVLWETLGIGDLDALQARAEEGRLVDLPGFGARTVQKILAEIGRVRSLSGRAPVARVWRLANELRDALAARDEVERCEIAGSLRRGRETVGDLDFVCASRDPAPVMEFFVGRAEVEEVLSHGRTKSSVRLRGDIQADLRVVEPEVFGATLHHFTGSRDHNIAMRRRAQERGLRVSEYGVFRVVEGGEDERIACFDERDIFAALDLPWIPPELREDAGEFEGPIPDLLDIGDLRGDLHMHTVASDGRNTVEEMAHAGHALGLAYICITDHSRSLTVANGLSRERLVAQIEEIEALRSTGRLPIEVLAGLEVDILEDGALDMDDDVLDRLDWVVGSVHSRMSMPPDKMTGRLLRAIESGRISAVGHPTGRLIGARDGFAFDFDAVLDACAAHGVALEINASAERLDLSAEQVRRVMEDGRVALTLNTDAHSVDGLAERVLGVRTARRGWATRDRVVNTWPLERLRRTFGRGRSEGTA
jgi:DNA polymerase (family 10)